MTEIKKIIEDGKTVIGIEFGSTRIKAVMADPQSGEVLASGGHGWENRLENGLWTYHLDEIISGLQNCYADLKKDVLKKYGVTLKKAAAIGISAMMHGYMAFDRDGNLLIPFRTWRNSNTKVAAEKLTSLFNFNIPERWSVSHLYQCILDHEEHLKRLDSVTTLAGFIHRKLTGKAVLGIGDAAGMFPVDSESMDYRSDFEKKFNDLLADSGFSFKLRDVFPKVLCAGEDAGTLTEEGARLIDPQGDLIPGIPLCPPEGDAGTGMTATNSVKVRTGNVSAGTSIFAMIVLERALKDLHREIDNVTTPDGKQVAMVHANNCTSDLNAWVGIFREFAKLSGHELDDNELFSLLYNNALKNADADCGGVLSYGYL